jgi:hypothetical protein
MDWGLWADRFGDKTSPAMFTVSADRGGSLGCGGAITSVTVTAITMMVGTSARPAAADRGPESGAAAQAQPMPAAAAAAGAAISPITVIMPRGAARVRQTPDQARRSRGPGSLAH